MNNVVFLLRDTFKEKLSLYLGELSLLQPLKGIPAEKQWSHEDRKFDITWA